MRACYTTLPYTADEYVRDFRQLPGFALIEPSTQASETEGGIILADRAIGELVRSVEPIEARDAGFEMHDHVIFDRWAGQHYETADNKILVLVKIANVSAVIEADQA